MAPDTSSEPTAPLNVYSVLATFLEQLGTVAWQKLGLQPDMITGRIEPNLEQAKVAIDAASDLAKYLEAELDEADKRQVHNLVRDLRLNYLAKQKETGSS